MVSLHSENLKLTTQTLILILTLILTLTFISASFASAIVVENINLNTTKDISLYVEFKNNESKIIAFSYNIFFDEEEILSDKAELDKNETKTVNFMLPIETKNLLYDCKRHNITLFVWIEGNKGVYSKEVRIDGKKFNVEISPSDRKSFGDTIEMVVKDDGGNIVKDAHIVIEKDSEVVKKDYTNMYGAFKFLPSDYGVGEYTITIKKHSRIDDEFYCDKTVKFPVKGKIKILHLPEYAKISDKVEIYVDMDEIPMLSAWAGKSVTGFYNIEILDKNTGKSTILSYPVTERAVTLNFTSPGSYTITVLRGNDYWTDSKDIEIVDKPILNIDIKKEVKVGDVVTGRIFADDVIYVDSLDVKIVCPDGSIIVPTIKDNKFSFTPTMSGEYEISFEDAEHKKNTVKVFALDKMFLEILPDEKNLKVGDIVRFRVSDSKNNTLSPKIYVNNKEVSIYYKIRDFRNSISVREKGFIPINKEIIAKGNNEIKIDKKILTYGEIQTIYAITEPKTDVNIKIINKNSNEKMEKSGNFVEFMPVVGEYFVEGSKEGYLTSNGTFTVMPAKMNVTIKYEEGYVKVMVFSKVNNIPIRNAKFNVMFPSKKNLTILTDEKGNAKFKPNEWGNYTFIIEKENFLTQKISKEIYAIDPVTVAIGFVILIVLFFVAFIGYKYVKYRFEREGRYKQEVRERIKIKEKEEKIEEGGLTGVESESPLSRI